MKAIQEAFYDQLGAVYENTDLQLIGSLGREFIAAAYNETPRPYSHRANSEPRDIDVLGLGTTVNLPERATSPFTLDTGYGQWVKREANGLWLVFPGDSTTAVEVQPEVFTPVERQIDDIKARTYALRTQQKLNRLSVFERPKDKRNFAAYDTLVSDVEAHTQGEDRPLPEKFYAPFDEFSQLVRQRHSAYFLACRIGVVVNSLPLELRRGIKQLGRPIRDHFLGKDKA